MRNAQLYRRLSFLRTKLNEMRKLQKISTRITNHFLKNHPRLKYA